jgi:hypothetical protein
LLQAGLQGDTKHLVEIGLEHLHLSGEAHAEAAQVLLQTELGGLQMRQVLKTVDASGRDHLHDLADQRHLGEPEDPYPGPRQGDYRWPTWQRRLEGRSSGLVAAPPMGAPDGSDPPRADATGEYVL